MSVLVEGEFMLVQTKGALKVVSTKLSTPSALVLTLSALAACGSDDTSNDQSAPTVIDNDDTADQNTGGNVSDAVKSLSLIVNNQGDADTNLTDLDQLNIVFQANASFDAKSLDEGAVINLGLTSAGDQVASLGTVDFDGVGGQLITFNVHSGAPHVEIDYVKDSTGKLVINFMNDDEAHIGEEGVADFTNGVLVSDMSVDLIDAKTVEFHHLSDALMVIEGSIEVDTYTTELVFTSHQVGGDLDAGEYGRIAAVQQGGALREVRVEGDYGDMKIRTPPTFHGDGAFIDDATELQSYVVTGNNGSFLDLGIVGYTAFADDLETISIHMENGASLVQAAIFSPYGRVSELSIVSSNSSNIDPEDHITMEYFVGLIIDDDFSIAMVDLYLGELSNLYIDTSAGGSVAILQSTFIVDEQVFVGSGDILIEGLFEPARTAAHSSQTRDPENLPLQQLEPADATDHTGARTFIDGSGHDIFYGSNEADTIIFQVQTDTVHIFAAPLEYSGEYRDAGGDDLIILSQHKLPVIVRDGDAGTDDTIESYGYGFFTKDQHRLEFHAGSGEDTIKFMGPVGLPFLSFTAVENNNVHLNLGTRIDGHVKVEGFYGNSAFFTISLEGLPGITNSNVDYFMNLDPTTPTLLDENAVYVLEDNSPSGNGLIADYENLNDVAGDLEQMFAGSSFNEGDSAVFVIHNAGAAVNGQSDYYFYLYNETGDGSGISSAELQHIATFDMYASSPLLTAVSFA